MALPTLPSPAKMLATNQYGGDQNPRRSQDYAENNSGRSKSATPGQHRAPGIMTEIPWQVFCRLGQSEQGQYPAHGCLFPDATQQQQPGETAVNNYQALQQQGA